MDLETIKAFAQALGTKVVRERREWADLHCPLAPWKHIGGADNHPSLGIQIRPNAKSRVKCLSCGFGSNDVTDLVLEIHRYLSKGLFSSVSNPTPKGTPLDLGLAFNIAEAEEFTILTADYDEAQSAPPAVPIEFPDWFTNSFHPVQTFARAVEYLHGRKVPEAIWEAGDLRYDKTRDRLVFLIRGGDGLVYGVHGRAIGSHEIKYLMYPGPGHITNPFVWYGEATMSDDADLPVIFAEGPFDRLRVYQLYRNVVSPLMTSFSRQAADRLSDCMNIITLFDPDPAGDTARNRVAGWWRHASIRHLYLPQGTDADSTSLSNLAAILGPHVDLDPLII